MSMSVWILLKCEAVVMRGKEIKYFVCVHVCVYVHIGVREEITKGRAEALRSCL